MHRYNTFTIIHKALRAMMYDAALTLQQTYFPDPAEAENALKKVEEVVYLFGRHARHEENGILPVIEKIVPELAASFEAEHKEEERLGRLLLHLAEMLRAGTAAPDRIACGSAIAKTFKDFVVFNLNHMEKEEMEINAILWENFTDRQLQRLHEAILRNVDSRERAVAAKWIMRGINKAEATAWLRNVKQTAPSTIFNSLYDLTETELPEHLRLEVRDAVMDAEPAA